METKSRKNADNQFYFFIALIKPHNLVAPSTSARWIKSTLSNSGINTDIFKAHSVRYAAASTAARAGVTVGDVINAADWSTKTMFKKFYHTPQRSQTFGSAVLKLSTNEKE